MLFVTIHNNHINWRTDKGNTGTDPHNGTVGDVFSKIESVLLLNGMNYSQLETRLEIR